MRFSIRDVIWLTVVMALVVGWWLDPRHVKWREEYRKVEQQNWCLLRLLEGEGYSVVPDREFWRITPQLQPPQP